MSDPVAVATPPDLNLEEITVDQFYELMSRENDFLLLDVRNDQDFENWRVESRFTPETMHVPYIIFAEDGPEALEEMPDLMAVPDDRTIVAICAKGGASDFGDDYGIAW